MVSLTKFKLVSSVFCVERWFEQLVDAIYGFCQKGMSKVT